jgi:hypothetical protein
MVFVMPGLTGVTILGEAAPATSKGSDHPSPSDVFWLIHLKVLIHIPFKISGVSK